MCASAAETERYNNIYAEEDLTVAHYVRECAIEHGQDQGLRIAMCGYDTEHDLAGWDAVTWKTKGGYGNMADGAGRANSAREVVWFSPGCVRPWEGRDFHMEMSA